MRDILQNTEETRLWHTVGQVTAKTGKIFSESKWKKYSLDEKKKKMMKNVNEEHENGTYSVGQTTG